MEVLLGLSWSSAPIMAGSMMSRRACHLHWQSSLATFRMLTLFLGVEKNVYVSEELAVFFQWIFRLTSKKTINLVIRFSAYGVRFWNLSNKRRANIQRNVTCWPVSQTYLRAAGFPGCEMFFNTVYENTGHFIPRQRNHSFVWRRKGVIFPFCRFVFDLSFVVLIMHGFWEWWLKL